MSEKIWQTIKICYCEHVGKQVGFEAQVIYPAEWLPDQPPRVVAHRCSYGLSCGQEGRPSCVWAGTHPAYDPFAAG